MKKICSIIVLCCVIILALCSCSTATANKVLDKSKCTQEGAYFPDENRYILVDEAFQDIGGVRYLCRVFADRYMGTMYLWMQDVGSGYRTTTGLTQIFYEDGCPMIYDGDEIIE